VIWRRRAISPSPHPAAQDGHVGVGGAVAVANSVDTTPEPARVSHYTDSTDVSATAPSPVGVSGTTPGTVDDHGGDRAGRSGDD
jgi:hypothetical protein